jgi:hypothetical protein
MASFILSLNARDNIIKITKQNRERQSDNVCVKERERERERERENEVKLIVLSQREM